MRASHKRWKSKWNYSTCRKGDTCKNDKGDEEKEKIKAYHIEKSKSLGQRKILSPYKAVKLTNVNVLA